MTANNETLERIKKDADKYFKGWGENNDITSYIAGAMYERDKAIDEAIEIVGEIEFIDRNPANVISDVIKQLSKLRT